MFYIERYLLFIAYPSAVNNAGQSIKGRSEHSNSIESNTVYPKFMNAPYKIVSTKNHLNAHYAQKMNGKECMEMKSGPKNDTQIINNINNKLI